MSTQSLFIVPVLLGKPQKMVTSAVNVGTFVPCLRSHYCQTSSYSSPQDTDSMSRAVHVARLDRVQSIYFAQKSTGKNKKRPRYSGPVESPLAPRISCAFRLFFFRCPLRFLEQKRDCLQSTTPQAKKTLNEQYLHIMHSPL